MDQKPAQKIDIDWTSCRGHGLCAELLPDHITLDEWGYPLVDGTPVPARTLKRARRAAADCPVLALKLTATGMS
ncbi:ferredoxin [Streptomyces cylindrosporus]|uniref:Ferredoxin n=1 Tax=Streptomyces cylindrosporus TaxID=2927583 RepID=A0ABS9YKU0_9ACTN|nr:ferredoxin [Streptomyces cylindrosporus]MCI3277862.1 ferredoxin [Streptomyces cylindrosporus]